ncbi:MAG TPA: M23 family metallopeptidase [Spirochaetales bacterium]|nr:M23 family metallopeptidase [Spirochaetales bacterium]HRY54261.1 M23 family metallopeptidase [Spirochaetia bacterium]
MRYRFRDAKSRSWARCPASMGKRAFAFAAIVVLFAAAMLALGIGPRGSERLEEAPALSEDGEQAEAPTAPLDYATITIQRGDTLSGIAQDHGVRVDTLVSFNGITDSRALRLGADIRVPNQDGLLYTAREGDDLESISARYAIPVECVRFLTGQGRVAPGDILFLAGARMDPAALQRINGDLFMMPAKGSVSSPFGLREDPFTGVKVFHHGIDLAVPWGSTVTGTRSGKVVAALRDDPTFGNYVIISHGEGYTSYYFHLSSIQVRVGQSVAQGQPIGRVGNTGAVTGTHLHFGIARRGTYFNPLDVLGKAQ